MLASRNTSYRSFATLSLSLTFVPATSSRSRTRRTLTQQTQRVSTALSTSATMPASNNGRRVQFHGAVYEADIDYENTTTQGPGLSDWAIQHASSLREDHNEWFQATDQGHVFRADVQETFMSGAEIVEMHQTGNYHEDLDVSPNEVPLPDDDEDDDEVDLILAADDTITEVDFVHQNGVADTFDDGSSTELPEAILESLSGMTLHLPEGEALRQGRALRDFLEEYTINDYPATSLRPRWQIILAADMLKVMKKTSRELKLRRRV